jgi:hypothetical protein
MKQTELEKKLISAARLHQPSDRVPYAFEKRVMAIIRSRPVSDIGVFWARALLRSAGACLALVVLIGTVSFFAPQTKSSTGDLSQEFEQTMLAALDSEYTR